MGNCTLRSLAPSQVNFCCGCQFRYRFTRMCQRTYAAAITGVAISSSGLLGWHVDWCNANVVVGVVDII